MTFYLVEARACSVSSNGHATGFYCLHCNCFYGQPRAEEQISAALIYLPLLLQLCRILNSYAIQCTNDKHEDM